MIVQKSSLSMKFRQQFKFKTWPLEDTFFIATMCLWKPAFCSKCDWLLVAPFNFLSHGKKSKQRFAGWGFENRQFVSKSNPAEVNRSLTPDLWKQAELCWELIAGQAHKVKCSFAHDLPQLNHVKPAFQVLTKETESVSYFQQRRLSDGVQYICIFHKGCSQIDSPMSLGKWIQHFFIFAALTEELLFTL